jgi:hypothetical protein
MRIGGDDVRQAAVLALGDVLDRSDRLPRKLTDTASELLHQLGPVEDGTPPGLGGGDDVESLTGAVRATFTLLTHGVVDETAARTIRDLIDLIGRALPAAESSTASRENLAWLAEQPWDAIAPAQRQETNSGRRLVFDLDPESHAPLVRPWTGTAPAGYPAALVDDAGWTPAQARALVAAGIYRCETGPMLTLIQGEGVEADSITPTTSDARKRLARLVEGSLRSSHQDNVIPMPGSSPWHRHR